MVRKYLMLLSVLLCAAVLAAWVATVSNAWFVLVDDGPGWARFFLIKDGEVQLVSQQAVMTPNRRWSADVRGLMTMIIYEDGAPVGSVNLSVAFPSRGTLGFSAYRITGPRMKLWGGSAFLVFTGLGVPLWFPAVLFGAGPLLSLARYGHRRRRRCAGRCQKCGYDLRATPGRCPECGAVAFPTSSPKQSERGPRSLQCGI